MTEISAITTAYPALLAIGNAITSKLGRQRTPNLGRVPYGFAPPNLADMRRLLDPALDSRGLEQRLARITALSISQALEATRSKDRPDDPFLLKPGGNADYLSSRLEHTVVRERTRRTRDTLGKLSELAPAINLCRYCTMFQELYHLDLDSPPMVEVLSHSARIESDFDPRTNISQAGIRDFQLFVPEDLASQALQQSHPLLWEKTAPDMFKISRPAERGPQPYYGWRTKDDFGINDWTDEACQGGAVGYLYEQAVRPWNEQLSATLDNVFRITDFAYNNVQVSAAARIRVDAKSIADLVRNLAKQMRGGGLGAKPMAPRRNRHVEVGPDQQAAPIPEDNARILSYGYELQTCIRSNFGLGFQNGGLDVDDGRFDGYAVPCAEVTPDLVKNFTYGDLVHFVYGLARRYPDKHAAWEELVKKVKANAERDPATPIPPAKRYPLPKLLAASWKSCGGSPRGC